MKKNFNFKILLLSLLVVTFITLLLWKLSDMPLWVAFSITLIGILINSAVAEVEDNQPSGFNNPTNKNSK